MLYRVSPTRVKRAREDKGLSIYALSEITGMQHVAVSRIEAGTARVKASTVEKLATALGVSTDYLTGDTLESGTAPSASVREERRKSQARQVERDAGLRPMLQGRSPLTRRPW